VDDVRGGAEPAGHADPRLLRYMKWTWPVALAAAVALTAVTTVGWLIALVLWFATCAIPNHLDQKNRYSARQ
jgi:hypothetical protein